jgi:multiple sugar transport system ATP-binding protein
MARGDIQQVDTPGAIYRRPANRFVASFVGRLPMNFIPGQIVAVDGRARFESGVIGIDLRDQDPPAASVQVVLGVRPEGVRVIRDQQPSSVTGRVTLTEVVAPDEYATIAVAERTLRARVPAEELAVGDEVNVTFAPSYLLFFDPETGERITLAADAGPSTAEPREAVAR